MSYLYLQISEGKYTNINSNIYKNGAYILNYFNIYNSVKLTSLYIKKNIVNIRAKIYICTCGKVYMVKKVQSLSIFNLFGILKISI